jgi:hypothetical protein
MERLECVTVRTYSNEIKEQEENGSTVNLRELAMRKANKILQEKYPTAHIVNVDESLQFKDYTVRSLVLTVWLSIPA